MTEQRRSIASRETDERDLEILHRWDRGEGSPAIGSAMGLTASAVRVIVRRINLAYAASERDGRRA